MKADIETGFVSTGVVDPLDWVEAKARSMAKCDGMHLVSALANAQYRRRVLRAARMGNYVELVRVIHRGHKDANGEAFELAAQHGFLTLTQAMVELGPEYGIHVTNTAPHGHVAAALGKAAAEGHCSVVQFLCKSGAPANVNSNEPLRDAAANGHVDVVMYLSSLPGVDPSDKNDEALCRAADNGHDQVVEFLCSLPRVHPDARHHAPLFFAAGKGHVHIVEFLSNMRRLEPEFFNDVFRLAAALGRLHVLRTLRTHYPRLIRSCNADMALCTAAANGHVQVVRFLVEKCGADPKAQKHYALRRSLHNTALFHYLSHVYTPSCLREVMARLKSRGHRRRGQKRHRDERDRASKEREAFSGGSC